MSDPIIQYLSQYWGAILAVIIGSAILSIASYSLNQFLRPKIDLKLEQHDLGVGAPRLQDGVTWRWKILVRRSVAKKCQVVVREHITSFPVGSVDKTILLMKDEDITPTRGEQGKIIAELTHYSNSPEFTFVYSRTLVDGIEVKREKKEESFKASGSISWFTFEITGENLRSKDERPFRYSLQFREGNAKLFEVGHGLADTLDEADI